MEHDDEQLRRNVLGACTDYLIELRHQNPPRQFRHRAQRRRWQLDRAAAWERGVIPFRPTEIFKRGLTRADWRALNAALAWLEGGAVEVIRGRRRITHLKLCNVVTKPEGALA